MSTNSSHGMLLWRRLECFPSGREYPTEVADCEDFYFDMVTPGVEKVDEVCNDIPWEVWMLIPYDVQTIRRIPVALDIRLLEEERLSGLQQWKSRSNDW